jgi:hypothetical protein
VPVPVALLLVAVLGATPVQAVRHLAVARVLRDRAGPGDALLAEQRDLLWLAPYHPGEFYAAHSVFLTVDFLRKEAKIAQFLRGTPDEQLALLRKVRIGFVYVRAGNQADALAAVPGLVPVVANTAGTLFEFPEGLRARRDDTAIAAGRPRTEAHGK